MIMAPTTYITTDPESDFMLERGKHYFADFDISNMPFNLRNNLSADSIKYGFIKELRDRGHEPSQVTVSFPEYDVVRISFIANPLPLYLIVAIIVGVIIVASGIAAGVYVMFLGFGKGGPIPVIVETAFKNPWAVIAIVAAVGIFILGVKIS